MPTEKPRFTITTSKPIFETISRLAYLQNSSRSQVINELLESVHPPLMRTVALLEAAQEAPEQVKAGLSQTVMDLERELAGNVGSGLAQMDWLMRQMTPDAAAKAGSASPAAASTTPPSNTGVPPNRKKGTTARKASNTAKKRQKRVGG